MSLTENPFLRKLQDNREAEEENEEKKWQANPFLNKIEKPKNPQESKPKSTLRTALQIPAGLAKAHPVSYGLDLLKLFTEGSSKEVLNELAENDPDLLKDVAEQARQKALSYFPTQQLAEEVIEEKTGLPLEPQNKLQKALRLGATAASLRPGNAASKGIAGVVAPTAKAGLEALGTPEPLAEFGGLLASGAAPSPKVTKSVKPSGLPGRQFENVKKPTNVTASRLEKITETVEKDFRKLTDELLAENKTYSAMKDDSFFKEKVGDLFERVEQLAEEIPGTIHTEDLRKAFKKTYGDRPSKGITPDEFERSLKREHLKIAKRIPFDKLSAPQLVDQFRKNNRSLRELYEPGKSSGFNRAKKEALLDYNRSIESVIKEKYPETEFKDLFEFTNKRWQEINDIEQIDKFVGDIFSGKINFPKAKQIFRNDKENTLRSFKRILGDEGFSNFKALTEDLLSFEKPISYLKKAENAGFKDLAKVAASYVLHPGIGKAVALSKYGKIAYQMLLDKPKLAVTWETALGNLKAGHYKEAEKSFKELDSQVKGSTQSSHSSQ